MIFYRIFANVLLVGTKINFGDIDIFFGINYD